MVWSLSQDDDGLESLGAGEATPVRSVPPRPPQQTPRAPESSSVIVDPHSQVPERQDRPQRRRRRRTIEPTLVLKSRKLDQMRKDVERKRRQHARRQRRILAFWVLSGAAAVSVGALLAQSFGGGSRGPRAAREIQLHGGPSVPRASSVKAAAQESEVVAPPPADTATPSDASEPRKEAPAKPAAPSSGKDGDEVEEEAAAKKEAAPSEATAEAAEAGAIRWEELPDEEAAEE